MTDKSIEKSHIEAQKNLQKAINHFQNAYMDDVAELLEFIYVRTDVSDEFERAVMGDVESDLRELKEKSEELDKL